MDLYPYQQEGVAWLQPRKYALLADQPGLGKSCITLKSLPPNARALVVCPAAVKGVWARETRLWRPDLKPVLIPSRARFAYPAEGEVAIVSYGLLPKRPEFPPRYMHLVADEVHLLRHSYTDRTLSFRHLFILNVMQLGSTWGITGTPLLNYPRNLWNVLRSLGLVEGSYQNWETFLSTFNGWEEGRRTIWGDPTAEAAERLSRVMLRRRRADVLPQLPPLTSVDVPIDLTLPLEPEDAGFLAGAGFDLPQARKEVGDTLRSELGRDLFSRLRYALALCKIPALLDLLKGFENEPVVVFSDHQVVADVLRYFPGWAAITGSDRPAERTRAEDAFQRGELRGLVCTIGAAGVGITLTRACNVVMVDRAWTPALNQQAEDRIRRLGQTRPVTVFNLVTDHPLEQRLIALLGQKQSVINAALMDAAEGASA